jgi:hypothetical protein
VATSESSPNTIDGGPLQFTTDWTTTNILNKNFATITPLLGATFTNSACSASGQPSSFTATLNHEISIVATLDNGQTVTFTGTADKTGTQITGTFTSSGGGCTQADSGNFTATFYAPLQGTFTGTIESFADTNPFTATISLAVDSNFNETGSVQVSGKACLANLTINGTAAQAFGSSIATGDTLLLFASDNNGNVAGFVVSATDQNGNALSPPWPMQFFVTYEVLAGSCSGNSGTDAPFHLVENHLPHPHMRSRAFPRREAVEISTPRGLREREEF